MKIAFDAKRAYQNTTGLGHYSRTLISSLAAFYPQHSYFLCAPKLTNRYDVSCLNNVKNIIPTGFLSRKIKSVWRSNWVKAALLKEEIDLYHGLSHEIPVGIQKTGIRSVVTIHDLIFERYPRQYNRVDVAIYRQKFRYACRNADHVIAISQQTKEDIISFYKIDEKKISVCYQSCDPAFTKKISAAQKEEIKHFYGLPDRFFLYVGSIIERKNLLGICKALLILKGRSEIPLVVIGEGDHYKKLVKDYLSTNGLEQNVIFLSENKAAKSAVGFQSGADFPAIYQLATALIYPSLYEGFGIPVLEALWSQAPVITSNTSCLPETGGNAALYVDPYSPQQIAAAMIRFEHDKNMVEQMKEKGLIHAQNFTAETCAAKVMEVYLRCQ